MADTVDDEWRQEQLPHESCTVPAEKLPDPEADNGDSHLTLLEQVTELFDKININSIEILMLFFVVF